MRINGNLRILVTLLAVCFAAMLVAASTASAAQSDIKAPKAKFSQSKSGKYVRIPQAATIPPVPAQNPVTSNPAGPTSYCCSYPAPAWGTAATYGSPGSYCCTYPAPASSPPAASWRAPQRPEVERSLLRPRRQPNRFIPFPWPRTALRFSTMLGPGGFGTIGIDRRRAWLDAGWRPAWPLTSALGGARSRVS